MRVHIFRFRVTGKSSTGSHSFRARVAIKATTGKLDTSVAELVTSPFLLIAIAGGIAAFFISARSLQIGPAVPVIAVTSIAGNASAIPAGVVVFGDPLGDDALMVALRSLAFILVTAAAATIPAPPRPSASAAPRSGVS